MRTFVNLSFRLATSRIRETSWYFGAPGGYILPGHGYAAKQVQDILKTYAMEKPDAFVPVHKESGVYKFYLKIPGYNKVDRIHMPDADEEQAVVGGGAADFPRQPHA